MNARCVVVVVAVALLAYQAQPTWAQEPAQRPIDLLLGTTERAPAPAPAPRQLFLSNDAPAAPPAAPAPGLQHVPYSDCGRACWVPAEPQAQRLPDAIATGTDPLAEPALSQADIAVFDTEEKRNEILAEDHPSSAAVWSDFELTQTDLMSETVTGTVAKWKPELATAWQACKRHISMPVAATPLTQFELPFAEPCQKVEVRYAWAAEAVETVLDQRAAAPDLVVIARSGAGDGKP
jgi:hypothetical protein